MCNQCAAGYALKPSLSTGLTSKVQPAHLESRLHVPICISACGKCRNQSSFVVTRLEKISAGVPSHLLTNNYLRALKHRKWRAREDSNL